VHPVNDPSAPAASSSSAAARTTAPVGAAGTQQARTPSLFRDAEAVIRGQIHPRARRCYQEGLRSDPSQAGRLVIRVHIAPSGDVDESIVASNNGLASSVADCVADAARQAHFDPPGDLGSTISIPFNFIREIVADAGGESSPFEANAGPAMTASSTQGSERGAATDKYLAQLASWFAANFQIRGKIPFERLKTLHAFAYVTVTPDRKVGSFSVVRPSGDASFDYEVRAALGRLQERGAELPAPPMPNMLGQSLPVGFQCTVRQMCE
jgi:hypothetical protein